MSYTCFEVEGSSSRRQIIPFWFLLYNYITVTLQKAQNTKF